MVNKFIKKSYEISPFDTAKVCIHVVEFEVNQYSDIEFARAGIEFPAQLHKAVIKRKSEYLAGRYAAKLALSAEELDKVQVGTGMQREPLWPEGVVGSLSHCKNMAACCVFRPSEQIGLGVGIDIESPIDRDTVDQIQDQVLSPEEALLVFSNCSKEQVAKRFTQVFSAKESLYKSLFPLVNTFFDCKEAVVVDIDDDNNAITLELVTTLSNLYLSGQQFTARLGEISGCVFTTVLA